jgi:hypothetical protein
MKISIFWDIMSYDMLKVNRHFRGRFHLQGQRISETRNQHEAGSFMLVYWETNVLLTFCGLKSCAGAVTTFFWSVSNYLPDCMALHLNSVLFHFRFLCWDDKVQIVEERINMYIILDIVIILSFSCMRFQKVDIFPSAGISEGSFLLSWAG